MQEGLDEDDIARPAVQEVEVLVRDPRYQGQDTLALGQGDRKRRKRKRERANAVSEPAEPCPGIVEPRRFLDRRHPRLVHDSHEAEDEEIAQQAREHRNLQSRDAAKESP